MVTLISQSLPAEQFVRIHVSGDFYNQNYFDAWCSVARIYANRTFYAYTKSLTFWVARLSTIPTNFVLTASKGGRYDDLIAKHNLKYAEVVYTEADAAAKGLEIDHDDYHAIIGTKPFALLLHGGQPAKSLASKALSVLKKQGIGGYPRKR
jgi:hypothetical protein